MGLMMTIFIEPLRLPPGASVSVDGRFKLSLQRVLYSKFEDTLATITQPKIGPEAAFIKSLEARLTRARPGVPQTLEEALAEEDEIDPDDV